MVFGSLLLIVAAFALPDSLLPIILGFLFIILLPGYAILAALFPASKDLTLVERVAISFALSIAIAPIVGVGLNYSEIGAGIALVLLTLAAITLPLTLVALFMRGRTEYPYLPPRLGRKKGVSFGRRKSNQHKFIGIALVVAIVASASGLAYLIDNPPQPESFTEFYILAQNGNASGYPQNLIVGQSASLQLGIVNHENRPVNYTLEVWLSNTTVVNNQTNVQTMYFFETTNITLPDVPASLVQNGTKQYETNYTFQVQIQGQFRLFFLLYKDHEPALPDSPMIPYHDYAATQAFRITDAVKNNVMSLNLFLNVNPPAQ